MPWFDPIGPALADVVSVYGYREATGSAGEFTAEELAILNTPLPHEGGNTRIRRTGLAMSGAYEVTYGFTQHSMPPRDSVYWTQGFIVEPVLYYVTKDLVTYKTAGRAYNPVPTNTFEDKVRFSRAIGWVHFTASYDESLDEGTFTLPTTFEAVRLGGKIYGWREWWQTCHYD